MEKSRSLPTRFVRFGDEIVRYGVVLVCVRRPDGLAPCDCCKGCWFSSGRKVIGGRVVMVNCNDIQCSVFDRMDGRDVWFKSKDDVLAGR